VVTQVSFKSVADVGIVICNQLDGSLQCRPGGFFLARFASVSAPKSRSRNASLMPAKVQARTVDHMNWMVSNHHTLRSMVNNPAVVLEKSTQGVQYIAPLEANYVILHMSNRTPPIVVPIPEVWSRFQEVRAIYDKDFAYWPPHMPLMCPFWLAQAWDLPVSKLQTKCEALSHRHNCVRFHLCNSRSFA